MGAWGRLRSLFRRVGRPVWSEVVLTCNEGSVSERTLWTMYGAGLYASVMSAQPRHLGWRTHFAKAVSFAACGQFDASLKAVDAFLRCPGAERERVALAEAIAQFLPKVALDIIDSIREKPLDLQVALLARTSQHDRARQLVESVSVEALKSWPELLLHRSNLSEHDPGVRLEYINRFLAATQLSQVRLRDQSRAPSPVNLAPAALPQAMDGPLVSVLMTVYRTGDRVAAAVESLLAQSYRNLELIVVDDASGDETPALLEALARRDARIRLLMLPRNVGTYAAKLIALAQAQGEFVTCHDSDDWSHPEKIARQVAPLLENERLICTVSNWVRMEDSGLFYARQVHPLGRLNPSSPLFRRKRVLSEAGAWDCVRTGADSEFLARLRVVFGARAVKKVAQPLSFGSHRADSLMTCSRTGYSEEGISPQRLEYWEAWSRWHVAQLVEGRKPHMSPDVMEAARKRPFSVPASLYVPAADVEACVRALASQSTQS